MKTSAFLTLCLPAVLGSPAAAPGDAEGDGIAARDANTSCNPYTDWGHTKGAHGYYCTYFANSWGSGDWHCISYKVDDYCSGKVNYCSDTKQCPANEICHYGVCVKKVNGKMCQRTCTY